MLFESAWVKHHYLCNNDHFSLDLCSWFNNSAMWQLPRGTFLLKFFGIEIQKVIKGSVIICLFSGIKIKNLNGSEVTFYGSLSVLTFKS